MKQMVKMPLEVRRVRKSTFTVSASPSKDGDTADFVVTVEPVRVIKNRPRAYVLEASGVDIKSINRALREPHEPIPGLTATDVHLATR